MAISKAPESQKPEQPKKQVSEKKIQEFINQGGSATAKNRTAQEGAETTKSIKLIMTATEMAAVKQLRDKRPKSRSRKIPISVHDWVIEAIQEKIEREQKKYGITLL
jgi:translation initiation factor 2B subunit (eIF-2B alpha/beta/delta family)